MNHYIHHVPGRMRVKSPLIKGNEKEAARLRNLLVGVEGVLSHEVKSITGSILISYDTALTQAPQILAFLEEHNYLKLTGTLRQRNYIPAPQRSHPLRELGSSMGKAFGKAVVNIAVEKLAERSAMALISAIL
jgi:cell division FtsZ-interacting protein ZapD